jgi:quercetin dioxygenase-like cupin family protein
MVQLMVISSKALKDASHLYGVEFRQYHLVRPGFRINELRLSPTQQVPWHSHSAIRDTFYVIDGRIRLFLQKPKEAIDLGIGDSYVVEAGRPHLVANGGDRAVTFLVLQGVGEYDYVPLLPKPMAGAE